jgi:hypothetical protein
MWLRLRLMIIAAFATASSGALVFANGLTTNEITRDLVQLVDRSNLIFLGHAQKVVYRNAQGDEGEGVIPYTIVTYSIERVLRGKPPGKSITMRFVGGSDGRGRFLTATGVPLIQEGDRDVLFVATTDDPSCPLVFCDDGRYRVLNERVFDNVGSPVTAIVEDTDRGSLMVISGGMPPEQFQIVRFLSPPFDELIQNPEVAAQLQSLNMTEDEARRRYELEAPGAVELKREFPAIENPTDAGPSGSGSPPGAPITPPGSTTTSVSEALPLTDFIAMIQLASQRSTRTPLKVQSIDPAAKIVPARAALVAPQQVPPVPPLTQGDTAESRAFEQNSNNPVIPKSPR